MASCAKGYWEIEFVCVNPNYQKATSPQSQCRLLCALRKVPGLFVYRQQDEGTYDISMAVVILDRSAEQTVRDLAQRHGVSIDLERCVPKQTVDEVRSNRRGIPVLDWFLSGESEKYYA